MFSLRPAHVKATAAAAVIAAAALLMAAPASAGTATSTFTVSTTVGQTCDIATQNITFTGYTGMAQVAAGNNPMTVTCNAAMNPTPSVVLTSVNYNGNTGTWQMRWGGTTAALWLGYQLCQDQACTQPWTNGTNVTLTTWTLNPNNGVYTSTPAIWAFLPAINAAPAAGTWTDKVVATLTF